MMTFLAQEKNLGTLGNGQGLGPFGNIDWGFTGTLAGAKLGSTISAIVGLFTVIASIWFLFQLVIGAIAWISSGGDKAGLQQAREKITNGIIGLVIIVSGIAIVSIIGTFLGFDILNVASFLDKIQFK